MSRLLFLLILSILMTGCQSINDKPDFNSPTSKPPVGTIIQLNNALTFHAGYSRTFIQNGLPKPFNNIDERNPWCQFYRYEPPAALETVRTVKPDSFRVISSTQNMELVSAPVVTFMTSTNILSDMLDRGAHEKTLSTVMKIKSARQPEIVEFKCAIFDEPYRQNFISVNQILQTVGDVVTFTNL